MPEFTYELPSGWERSETCNEIPYYLDHNKGITQWDHPAVMELFVEFDNLHKVMYCAYRTAMKIRLIQALTNMYLISVDNIIDSYETKRREIRRLSDLATDSDDNGVILSVQDIEVLLFEIFKETSEKELSVEIALNILLKIFDSGRTGCLNSHSALVGLIVFSCGTPQSKYKGMFDCFADDGGISTENLYLLLKDILLITECIGEGPQFGMSYLSASMHSCKHENESMITKSEFLDWTYNDPQIIVWLSTVNRLAVAETVKHEAKCSVCKAYPIVGLRFKCLKCVNTDICQNCFLSNKGNRSHKNYHPTKEYCLATTSTDDIKDFFKQLKNKVTRRYRHHPTAKNFLSLHPYMDNSSEQRPRIHNLMKVHEQVKSLSFRLQEVDENEIASPIITEDSIYTKDRHLQTRNSATAAILQTSSTAELLDKGISVSTMDTDLALGGESELLQKLTKRMLGVFNEKEFKQNDDLIVSSKIVVMKSSKFIENLEDC